MNVSWTTHPFSLLRGTAIILCVAVLICLTRPADCTAGIGLAEWTIETPGKHLIAHADPLADAHGVYLRRPTQPGEDVDDQVVVVSHVEWWMYFKGHVVGRAKNGFFIFDERSREVQYWKDQVGLDKRLKELDLGKPLSKRMVPQDGWNMVWGPVIKRLYQKQLTELQEGRGVAKDLSAEERESLKKRLQEMLERLNQ